MRTDKPQTETYWMQRPIRDAHRDWTYNKQNWVKDYWASIEHPHRKLILEIIEQEQPSSLLEVGCNCGPNLGLINREYPGILLAGIDASKDAIAYGKLKLPRTVAMQTADFYHIPFADRTFDIVLDDAALMYAPPDRIKQALRESLRVARNGLIIIERQHIVSKITGAVWAHNYKKLLQDLGLVVTKKKFKKDDWPESKNWVKFGCIITAFRPQ